MDEAVELVVRGMFPEQTVDTQLPSDTCQVCGKTYKSYKRLKEHIIKNHPSSCIIEGVEGEDADLIQRQSFHLLKLLLIKKSLDWSIKTGNGSYLSLLMKHMILYFRQLGYRNYALACFEHTAQIQIFLSDRLKELISYIFFVNNRGQSDSNMAMVLHLEHSNKFFTIKDNFTLTKYEPSVIVQPPVPCTRQT